MNRVSIIGFILLAAIYWTSLWLDPIPYIWIAKFTPMLIAAALVWRRLAAPAGPILAIGFVAAAGGDLFLALDRGDYFTAGLACFLVTQIAYSVAFLGRRNGFLARWPWWLPVVAIGLGMFILLRPGLGENLIPVTIYIAALITMAVSASLVEARPGRIYAGAVLFVISDALIGIDRFLGSFEHSLKLIIASYFIAQFLILTGALRAFPTRNTNAP